MSSKNKRRIKYLAFLAPVVLIALVASVAAMTMSSGPVSLADAQETAPCNACHNNTTLIEGKDTQWETSLHGEGEAYLRGTSAGCAGCHSGGGFSAMVAAGQQPGNNLAPPDGPGNPVGDPNPTRQSCRACHQVHDTFTGIDWALETTSPVDFYVTGIEGVFDGGNGNLCASCHQPRTKAPSVASGGTVTGISSHWGPHHGPESTMMLGTNGAGPAAAGTPSAHYSTVGDTCATCHMGSADNHSFAPAKATCQGCHEATDWASGASNFDVGGVQTEVQGKLDNLKGLLINAGIIACEIDEEGVEECHTVIPAGSSSISLPDNQAYALWNFKSVGAEDGSKGVHNADYANALLDASIAGMTP